MVNYIPVLIPSITNRYLERAAEYYLCPKMTNYAPKFTYFASIIA